MVWIIEDFSEHILVRLQAEVVETRETRGAEAKSVTKKRRRKPLIFIFRIDLIDLHLSRYIGYRQCEPFMALSH